MKYHYQIVNSFDLTDIPIDSSKSEHELIQKGWRTSEIAATMGDLRMRSEGFNNDQYYVRIVPVVETITEEDELDRHTYPGHEMWDDFPTNIHDYNQMCEDNERSFK